MLRIDRLTPNTTVVHITLVTLAVLTVGGLAGRVGWGRGDIRANRNKSSAAPPVQAASPAPLDLIENTVAGEAHFDYNGFLKNPVWGWQVTHGQLPDPYDLAFIASDCPNPINEKCTTQVTDIDLGGAGSLGTCHVPNSHGRPPGHVNWDAATYDGTICFGGFSSENDGDYTWRLKPGLTTAQQQLQPGLTKKNGGGIHVEFSSDESVDGFITTTWTRIRSLISNCPADIGCQPSVAKRLLDGRRAIVTGLVGLDTVHGGYTELHPAYALAIEINPDPNDNTWLIMVRNWGSEGWCGHHNHPLPQEALNFKLLLPIPPGSVPESAEFASNNKTQFASVPVIPSPTVQYLNGQGALLTFQLTPEADLPDDLPKGYFGPLVEGELHLRWVPRPGETINPVAQQSCGGSIRMEDVAENPLRQLTFRQRQNFLTNLTALHTQSLNNSAEMLTLPALKGAIPKIEGADIPVRPPRTPQGDKNNFILEQDLLAPPDVELQDNRTRSRRSRRH